LIHSNHRPGHSAKRTPNPGIAWMLAAALSAAVSACGASAKDPEGRLLPDDAQVIRDVTPRDREGVIDVATVDGSSGEAYFHSGDLAWYFDRGVVVRRKANIAGLPDAVLVVGGLARYVYNGNSYEYAKLLVSYNEYEGIPRPSDADLVELVENRLPEVFVGREHLVLGVDTVRLVKDRRPTWHSATSFSVPFVIRYRYRTSNTSIDDRHDVFEIRFYKQEVDSPIHALMATEHERNVLDTETLAASDIDSMKTLRTNFN